MRVRVYFIRHGFSCTNALSAYGGEDDIKNLHKYLDPPLTNAGAEDIASASELVGRDNKDALRLLRRPDIVLCSSLLRAVQTALLFFPKANRRHPVYPIPFIKELGSSKSNMPSSPARQLRLIGEQRNFYPHGGDDDAGVNYRFVVRRDQARRPQAEIKGFSAEASITDYGRFISWLEEHIPLLVFLHGMTLNRTQLTIAIVGHSGFMRRYLSRTGKDHPRNAGVQEILFDWNKEGRLLEHMFPAVESYRKVRTKDKPHRGTVFQGFGVRPKEDFDSIRGGDNCRFRI